MTEFRNNYKYYEKFWKRRYKLFSKFDQGIIIDSLESWYSVTPEAIAKDQAEYCYEMLNSRNITILDGYCGIGGNSIQFAKIFHKVIAIDIDPIKIEAAKNNAKIYGVEDKIEFIVGDFFQVAQFIKADVVFLSPPWGGPHYKKLGNFDLQIMNGFKIFEVAKCISKNIAYYVPKNSNREQLLSLNPDQFHIVEESFDWSKVLALTVYYGDLSNYSDKIKFKNRKKNYCYSNSMMLKSRSNGFRNDNFDIPLRNKFDGLFEEEVCEFEVEKLDNNLKGNVENDESLKELSTDNVINSPRESYHQLSSIRKFESLQEIEKIAYYPYYIFLYFLCITMLYKVFSYILP